MRDLGTLLTTTGVVATFFAFFFAATGMYLQYRKSKRKATADRKSKEVHKGSSPGSLVPFEQQQHVEVADGGKVVKKDIVKPEKESDQIYTPPKKEAKTFKSSETSTPIFKKYMPSGTDSVTVEDSNEYIWE